MTTADIRLHPGLQPSMSILADLIIEENFVEIDEVVLTFTFSPLRNTRDAP